MSDGSSSEQIFTIEEVILGPNDEVIFDSRVQVENQPDNNKEVENK